jgi:hypothetical protein
VERGSDQDRALRPAFRSPGKLAKRHQVARLYAFYDSIGFLNGERCVLPIQDARSKLTVS